MKRHNQPSTPIDYQTVLKQLNKQTMTQLKLADVWEDEPVKRTFAGSGCTSALAVLPDNRLASGSSDKNIKIWDTQTGQCLKTLTGHSGYVFALTVLPNGQLASSSSDNSIKLWDTQTGQCLKTLTGHSHRVTALTVLPNGQLVSGSSDKSIKLWDTQTGQCLKTSVLSSSVTALTVLPSGLIASSICQFCEQTERYENYKTYEAYKTYQEIIYLWDTQAGHQAAPQYWGSYKGPLNRFTKRSDISRLWWGSVGITALTVLPNGQLVSCSNEFKGGDKPRFSSIRLWGMGTTGQCEISMEDSPNRTTTLTVLQNGRLAIGYDDGSIKLWGDPLITTYNRELVIKEPTDPKAKEVFAQQFSKCNLM